MAAGDGGRGRDLGAAALSVARVEAGQAGGRGGVALTAQGGAEKARGKSGRLAGSKEKGYHGVREN